MGSWVDWQAHQRVSTQATLWHQLQPLPTLAPSTRPRIPTLTSAISSTPHSACNAARRSDDVANVSVDRL